MTDVPLSERLETAIQRWSLTQPVKRITLTRAEAAAALGVSTRWFYDHVQHELRTVRKGQLILVPVKELERWVEREAANYLDR